MLGSKKAYDQASHMTTNELRELLYPDSFGKK